MKYLVVPMVVSACTAHPRSEPAASDLLQRAGPSRPHHLSKPGENGFQDYVLIGTPTYENRVGQSTESVTLQMIAAMLPGVKVGLVAQDEDEGDLWYELLEDFGVSSTDLLNLVIFPIPHSDVWFRDMGGVFIKGEMQGDTLAVVDFAFDGWGYGPISDAASRDLYAMDDQVASQLGAQMGIPVISSPMIFEAGALQSNGAGTLVYSLPAVTHRNPSWPQPRIEAELSRVLGPRKVLGMPVFHPADGSAVVDGPLLLDGRYLHYPFTVRHTDNFVSFVDEDTILVSQLPQAAVTNWIEQQTHDRMATAWNFLASNTDQDGHHFELVAFPDPGIITETVTADDTIWQLLGTLQGLQHYDPSGGEIILAASYMNYVVTNDVVLVPAFYEPGRNPRILDTDAEAVAILEGLYPDRKVVQIASENVVAGGGGMHCITQEVRSLSDFPTGG